MYKNRENYHPLDRLSQEVKAHAHFISEIDGLSEFIQNEVEPLKESVAELKEYIELMLEQIMWHSQVIGEPFPIWDHIAGVSIPPSNNEEFRFIKLSYNDSYNSGLLTEQTFSTDDTGIVSTGRINLSNSPINGKVVNLLNTEGRFLRPGNTSGILQGDSNKQHTHFVAASAQPSSGTSGNQPTATQQIATASWRDYEWSYRLAATPNAADVGLSSANGTETRVRNMSAVYFMRIL